MILRVMETTSLADPLALALDECGELRVDMLPELSLGRNPRRKEAAVCVRHGKKKKVHTAIMSWYDLVMKK